MYIINLSYYVTNLLYLSKLIQIYYNVGPNTFNENETIAKYEIMDGAPVRGESIPIRVFLAGYDLTPTMRDVNKRFSVRYFLNLVLMDEEDRRYFKQQVSYNFTINYFFSMYRETFS